MATGAFELGWELAGERRARKQQLEDEERQKRVTNLYDTGHALALKIPTLQGAERTQAMDALTNVEEVIKETYHPVRHPGLLQRDWDHLVDLIRRKPRPVPVNFDPTRTTTRTPDIVVPGTDITLPGRTVDVRPAAAILSPQQRGQMVEHDAARRTAEQAVEAAGLSPEEEAQITVISPVSGFCMDWYQRPSLPL